MINSINPIVPVMIYLVGVFLYAAIIKVRDPEEETIECLNMGAIWFIIVIMFFVEKVFILFVLMIKRLIL